MGMQEGYVNHSIEAGIGTVTFHHPRSNSLPGNILAGLAAAISELGSDPQVRVIILQSDGPKAFCAGASFDELLAIDNERNGKEFFSGFARVINAIRTADCFVIGRIHSHAVGGGVGLACAVDIAYATEKASIRLSELAIGIGPFVVGPAVERKVGTGVFTLLTATPGDRRSAEWSREKGIYSEVFQTEKELDERISKHAGELAGYSPEAMRELKRVVWEGTEHWDALLEERAAMSGKLVLSEFTSAAINRFRDAIAAKSKN
jgi:methylglutaconyl-CoA hydratase